MNFNPDEYETYKLRYGDILLNEGQSIELVGRPAMFRDELPGACYTNTIVRFRASAAVEPEYALILFLGYFNNGRFRKIAKAGTNIAHLGSDRFAQLEFPLPPFNEQKRIVSAIRLSLGGLLKIEEIAKNVRLSLGRSSESIFQSAFSGRLVKQDSRDGTGHDLLKLITGQHEAETTQGKGKPSGKAGKRAKV